MIDGSACIRMVRSVRQLMHSWQCPRVAYWGRCCFYCTPPSSSAVIGTNNAELIASDTTIYAVIPRPLLRSQVMNSLNQNFAAINSWCLKWHMRLNPKKTRSMLVSRSRTIAPGYGDLTLIGAEFEEP